MLFIAFPGFKLLAHGIAALGCVKCQVDQGNVIFSFDAGGWPFSDTSNAVDNSLVGWDLWPSVAYVHDTLHRHAIDLPNMLFCGGHAVPTDLKDLRDPENWAIEGWNKP